METIDIILSIISVTEVLFSILFAYLAFHGNYKRDRKKNRKNEEVFISDADYSNLASIELKKTLDKLEEKYDNLHSRVIKIEQEDDDHIKNVQIHNKGENNK